MAISAPRPFLPSDLDPSRALTRAITARALREIRGPAHGSADAILTEAWPRDMHAKAASAPITTSGATALAATAIAGFVSGLTPQSAAAKLMAAGIRVSLDGLATVSIQRASTNPLPLFVDEGAPIPVVQPVLAAATLGPAKKLAMIESLTGELADMSTENAETVIRTIMAEAAAKALDAAVFSTAPASSSRPAGILASPAVPITATAGGGVNALLGDVGALVSALTTAGGGSRVMVFAAPSRAAVLPIYAPGGFSFEVVPTPALAPATVVAIDPSAFASGFGPDVLIEVSTETLLHYEDGTPAQISTVGTPNVVAAPVRSMFQTNCYAVRLILRCAWAIRAPGLVQYITSVTW
jgi:hypothetical protein